MQVYQFNSFSIFEPAASVTIDLWQKKVGLKKIKRDEFLYALYMWTVFVENSNKKQMWHIKIVLAELPVETKNYEQRLL